jgi:hypothetical protein
MTIKLRQARRHRRQCPRGLCAFAAVAIHHLINVILMKTSTRPWCGYIAECGSNFLTRI